MKQQFKKKEKNCNWIVASMKQQFRTTQENLKIPNWIVASMKQQLTLINKQQTNKQQTTTTCKATMSDIEINKEKINAEALAFEKKAELRDDLIQLAEGVKANIAMGDCKARLKVKLMDCYESVELLTLDLPLILQVVTEYLFPDYEGLEERYSC